MTLHDKWKNLLLIMLSFSFLLVLTVMPAVNAQQSSHTFSQGFKADTGSGVIAPGALVSITENNSRSVELTTTLSSGRLAGVVDQSPLVSISTDDKEVQVVLSGTTSVLVSDINGPILGGDKITASPIAGIGMLATADSQVVGATQAKLVATDTQVIKDQQGKTHTVHIGRVPLQVGVAYYQAPGSNFLPPFIQGIANSVAGRRVSLIRVLLACALLLLSFMSVTVLIYTSARGAMSSLGRNPLAARAIRRSLYQIGVVALVVIGGALLASYLIIRI